MNSFAPNMKPWFLISGNVGFFAESFYENSEWQIFMKYMYTFSRLNFSRCTGSFLSRFVPDPATRSLYFVTSTWRKFNNSFKEDHQQKKFSNGILQLESVRHDFSSNGTQETKSTVEQRNSNQGKLQTGCFLVARILIMFTRLTDF